MKLETLEYRARGSIASRFDFDILHEYANISRASSHLASPRAAILLVDLRSAASRKILASRRDAEGIFMKDVTGSVFGAYIELYI